MVPKSHFLKCVAFLNQLTNTVQTLQDIINCYGKYETAAEILKECRLWNRFHANAYAVYADWLCVMIIIIIGPTRQPNESRGEIGEMSHTCETR